MSTSQRPEPRTARYGVAEKWPRLVAIVVAPILVIFALAVIAPQFFVEGLSKEELRSIVGPAARFDAETNRLKAQNDVRAAAIQGLVGLLILASAWVAWRQVRTTREGQVTERFSRSIDQLGETGKTEVRLGGIYALEQIARDPTYTRPVAEVYAAYLRTQSSGDGEFTRPGMPLPSDVRAVLKILIQEGLWGEAARESLDLSFVALPQAELAGVRLEYALLVGSNLTGANLAHAVLVGADLSSATLRKSRFDGADIRKAVLNESDLTGASLSDAKLQGAKLRDAILREAILEVAHLDGADLTRADLASATLNGASLISATLDDARLVKAIMPGSRMRGAELRKADLSGATLTGADLSDAVLVQAILVGADLTGATLDGAQLDGADMTRANLQGVDLSHVDTSRIIGLGQLSPAAYTYPREINGGRAVALEIEYAPGSASLADLRGAMRELLDEVARGGYARQEAEAKGIDLRVLERLDPEAIKVRTEGEGLTGLEFVVITFAAQKAVEVGEHVLTSFWDEVAVPWLKDRLGVDALGKERKRRKEG